MMNLERSGVSTSIHFSIASARLHANKGECTDAIVNYLAVLRSLPSDNRKRFTVEFLNALQAYLKMERNKNKVREVLNAASSLYEHEFGIWRVWAEWLFSQGEFLRSLELFKKAMTSARNDNEWLHAAVSVENVKSNLMDAWHWRMINDGKRNQAFQRALEQAVGRVEGTARVLDIGCGSGIFSVLAAKLAAEVYACDCDPVMCQVAQECFERNNVFVSVSKCHSNSMLLPTGTLCNILITETLDCAIFGEHIVQTVLDAKERLLTRNTAEHKHIVIPKKATAIFSLIESTDIGQENYYESGEDYAIISQACYTTSSSVDTLPRQPYTCAYLKDLPNGYRLISEPSEGLAVNFDNSAQLKLFNSGKFTTDIVLEAKEKGVAHAVVCWFRLNLFEDIELCTSPEDDLCWQQAIFPFYPSRLLQPGEKLRFEIFLRNHKLHCVPVESHEQPEQSLSSLLPFRQILKAPVDVDFLAMHNSNIRQFFWKALKEGGFGSVLDCTDLLISEGIGGGEIKIEEGLEYVEETISKTEVASNKPAIRYVSDKAMNLSNASCCPSPIGQSSAILFWPISSKGLLMDDYMASIIEVHIRSPTHQTRLIPSLIQLKACLISSTQLLNRSRLAVSDGLGYEMAAFPVESPHCNLDLGPMNTFKLQYFHEIEPSNLDYECLSENTVVFNMCFDEVEKELDQLTKVRNELEISVSQSGDCHAILYWFEFSDSPHNLESPNTLSMLENGVGKASAYIISESRFLQPGEKVKMQTSLHHGTVIFYEVEFLSSS